jgi:hypothetical protein
VDGVPARKRLLQSGLRAMSSLRVGEVVCCARCPYILSGDDEGRVAVGEVVEPASNRRFLCGEQTTAEANVVALAPFEGTVDEDVELGGYRGPS